MMVKFTKIFKLSFLLVAGLLFGGVVFDAGALKTTTKAEKVKKEFETDRSGTLISYNGNSKNVVIPDNVKSISFGAFMEHDEIETITLPEGLLTIDECAFYGCRGLKEMILPDSLVHIGRLAFGNCVSLSRIKMGKNLSEIMELFVCGCSSLEDVEVSESNANFTSDSHMLYDKNMECLILCPQKMSGKIYIPDSVVTIKEHAFLECENIKEVLIGKKVKYIDEAAFYGCNSLKKVHMNEELKKIRSYAFGNCLSLEKITLGSNVSYIGNGAFYGCDRLKELVCTSKSVEFGEDVFDKGLDLTIYAPNDSNMEIYAAKNRYNFEKL